MWSPEQCAEAALWTGLQSIVCLESERQIWGKDKSITHRFFVCSILPSAKQALQIARDHWGVENRLHWRLDVIFREDECRIRNGNAPQNMAIMRKFALNLLKLNKSKGSIWKKRLRSGWDNSFLAQVVAGIEG